MKNKAAIYIRVSHRDQAEFGYSLEAQKTHLKALCDLKRYEVYQIYEDAGISAKNTDRPQFQDMLEDMRNKKFDIIVCYKLDRLTRSLSDLDWLIKELEQYDCNLISASEDINTSTANGRFFIKIVILLAELELERTSERIKFVFEDKIKKGGAVTGKLPIGYKIGINDIGDKIVVKDESKKDIVLDIFNYYQKYQSLRKVSFLINEKYNLKKNDVDIKRIIRNELYFGKFHNNLNYTEPYFNFETWKK